MATGDWELELLMPEKRMRYLDDAVARSGGNPLPVEYILSTDPSVDHTGTLSADSIHERAILDETEGAVVKLRVKPDAMEGIRTSKSKVGKLSDITKIIKDGDKVAIGGSWLGGHPMAIIREIIRSGIKDLTAITVVGSIDIDRGPRVKGTAVDMGAYVVQ